MKGLWSLETTTLDPGLGIAVWNGIAAIVVVCSTIITFIPRKHKKWREAWMLQKGLVLLSLYFLVHWIDLSCRHNKLPTKYNYIIAGCFIKTIRAAADISVLWGILIMMSRLDRIDEMARTVPYIGILTFLALYHIFLLFALAFTWLSFADVVVVNSIAKARSGFEIAFSALQFFLSLIAAINSWHGQSIGQLALYRNIGVLLEWVGAFVLLRSFCEVVIVGQLDRWPKHYADIIRAREVTYALFSIGLAFFAVLSIVDSAIEQDPLLEEERIATEQVRNWVTNRHSTLTKGGTKTAPDFEALIKPLKTEVTQKKPGSGGRNITNITDDTRGYEKRVKRLKLEEIRRLEKFYEGCEPIRKCFGMESASGLP